MLLSALHLRMLQCQHFTSKEMLKVMKTMRNLSDSVETKECLPAVEGKLFPDIPYVFMSCDTNQDRNLLVIYYSSFIDFYFTIFNLKMIFMMVPLSSREIFPTKHIVPAFNVGKVN